MIRPLPSLPPEEGGLAWNNPVPPLADNFLPPSPHSLVKPFLLGPFLRAPFSLLYGVLPDT